LGSACAKLASKVPIPRARPATPAQTKWEAGEVEEEEEELM